MSSRTELGRPACRLRSGVRRGTATVEAVVALPTLVLLFIAVFYVRDLTTAKHDALITARTCAWLYSMNNCTEKPPGCGDILSDASNVDYSNADIDDRTKGLDGGGIAGFVGGIVQPVLDEVFGKATLANVNRSVPRPTLFGGDTANVAGKYHLACNVSETTLDSVAKGAWNTINPFQ